MPGSHPNHQSRISQPPTHVPPQHRQQMQQHFQHYYTVNSNNNCITNSSDTTMKTSETYNAIIHNNNVINNNHQLMNPSVYCDNREDYVSQYENVGYFPQDQLSLNENKLHESHMLNGPLYHHQKPKYPIERSELTANSYCQTSGIQLSNKDIHSIYHLHLRKFSFGFVCFFLLVELCFHHLRKTCAFVSSSLIYKLSNFSYRVVELK